MQLTTHFTDAELGVAGLDKRLLYNALFLCNTILEPLRLHFGPVHVHDGYRPAEHNANVGGKPTSYHLFDNGQAAADIDALPVSCTDVFDWLRLESKLPFDKVILETNAAGIASTVHIQVDRMQSTQRRLAYTGQTGDGTLYTPAEVR